MEDLSIYKISLSGYFFLQIREPQQQTTITEQPNQIIRALCKQKM